MNLPQAWPVNLYTLKHFPRVSRIMISGILSESLEAVLLNCQIGSRSILKNRALICHVVTIIQYLCLSQLSREQFIYREITRGAVLVAQSQFEITRDCSTSELVAQSQSAMSSALKNILRMIIFCDHNFMICRSLHNM